MTERRAIQRTNEVIAECPVNGICRTRPKGSNEEVSCSYCMDVVVNVDYGTTVYCGLNDRHEG